MRRGGEIEEPVGGGDQPLAEQRAADLEHQLVIVLKAELQDALDGPHGTGPVAQLEQSLAQAGEAIFVIGIEGQCVLKAAARPRILLPGEVRVRSSDMQFDGVGVESYAFFEDGQGFIVAAFVVEVMGLFVEVVGAEECVRHRQGLPRLVTDKLRSCPGRSKRTGRSNPIGNRPADR